MAPMNAPWETLRLIVASMNIMGGGFGGLGFRGEYSEFFRPLSPLNYAPTF